MLSFWPLLQCTKHITSTSGEPSPVSFKSLCENPTRKLGKTGNISHFHFLGGDVAVLFQILVQQLFLKLDVSKCCWVSGHRIAQIHNWDYFTGHCRPWKSGKITEIFE